MYQPRYRKDCGHTGLGVRQFAGIHGEHSGKRDTQGVWEHLRGLGVLGGGGSGCRLWLGRICRIGSTLGEKSSWGELGNRLQKDTVWIFNSTLGDKKLGGVRLP